MAAATTFYDLKATTANNAELPMSDFKGQVVLVVNTASKCGFTPQFEGLESLYRKYKQKGFVVLGFPCNQFMAQDPGTNEQIASFCELSYGVSFPIMKKCDVNGSNTSPVFSYLKHQRPGFLGLTAIKWNFTKFLVDRNGKVVQRYSPTVKPQSIEKDIETYLDHSGGAENGEDLTLQKKADDEIPTKHVEDGGGVAHRVIENAADANGGLVNGVVGNGVIGEQVEEAPTSQMSQMKLQATVDPKAGESTN